MSYYEQKYLKYKTKYLTLKNGGWRLFGGIYVLFFDPDEIINKYTVTYCEEENILQLFVGDNECKKPTHKRLYKFGLKGKLPLEMKDNWEETKEYYGETIYKWKLGDEMIDDIKGNDEIKNKIKKLLKEKKGDIEKFKNTYNDGKGKIDMKIIEDTVKAIRTIIRGIDKKVKIDAYFIVDVKTGKNKLLAYDLGKPDEELIKEEEEKKRKEAEERKRQEEYGEWLAREKAAQELREWRHESGRV